MDETKKPMPEINTWDDLIISYADVVKSNQGLASETIASANKHARNWMIAFLVTLAVLFVTNAYWIHEMNSYEYVLQNGEGQNNFNKNIDGDVNNVAGNQDEEER